MNLKNSNIIVTGGNGFLGKRICHFLSDAGATAIVPFSVDYDLRSQEEARMLFSDVLKKVDIDCVIHAAATVGGIGTTSTRMADYLMDNAYMGLNVIREAHIFDVPKVVVVGSVCSYPKYSPIPFNESNIWDGYPEESNAPYGIAKRLIGEALKAHKDQYGLKGAYLIMSNLYGPGDNFDIETSHVIPALIRKIYNAKIHNIPTVEVWGSGRPGRDFLYVDDAAQAVVSATEKVDNPMPINIGTGEQTNILWLFNKIKDHLNYDGEISFDRSKPDGQMKRAVMTNRAKDFMGWKYSTSISDGLKATIDWYISEIINED